MAVTLDTKTSTGLASLSNRILRAQELFEPMGCEVALSDIARELSHIERQALSSVLTRERNDSKVKLSEKELVALSMIRDRICSRERMVVFISREIDSLDDCVAKSSSNEVGAQSNGSDDQSGNADEFWGW